MDWSPPNGAGQEGEPWEKLRWAKRSGRVGGGMAVGTEVADTDLPTQFLFKSVCGFWRESYGHTEAGVPVQGPH